MTVAKRRAIDTFRRNRELEKRYAQLARTLEAEGDSVTPDFDRAFSDHIDDDLLRLIFTACHPVLSLPARTALTLRMLGGLTTDGDRPRLPRPGTDDRAADRARQEDPRAGARAVRGARRR